MGEGRSEQRRTVLDIITPDTVLLKVITKCDKMEKQDVFLRLGVTGRFVFKIKASGVGSQVAG